MGKTLSLFIKATVSALLLYFALAGINIGAVKDRLINIDPYWISLALTLILLQVFAQALRWQQFVIRCGGALAAGRAIRFSMIAMFFNQALPSSVGGDAVRLWLVGTQFNWRVGAYSVLLDRAIGVFVLAVLVIVCLPWSLALVRNSIGQAALLLIGFGCLAAGLAFISLAWKELKFLQHWMVTRHLAAAATVAWTIMRAPGPLGAILGLSVAIHIMTALSAWCAARAVDADLSLLYALFLVPPVVLIAVIPISIAGWGVREGAMVAAFTYAGLPESDGLLVSLLYGMGFLVVGIVGGLVWILSADQLNRGVASVPAKR